MVREARFSWDDLERLDPEVRNERADDFDGPDDDWVEDLTQAARRRRARKRRAHRPATGSDSGRGRSNATPSRPEARRHLAEADWLERPGRHEPRSEASSDGREHQPERPNVPPFPGDAVEHTDDAA